MENELHPWNWFAPEDSRVLIVGTFPPTKRNWSFDFFYPNKANLFWKVMARIAEVELQYPNGELAVEERKGILRKLGVAITDMGRHIQRSGNSSLDENLSVVEYMNIFQILDENPGIRKIIFTSSSGKESAARWFNNFLASHAIKHRFPVGKRPIKSAFQYNDRMIELVVLYSTSPRAANRFSFDTLVELYKNEILL